MRRLVVARESGIPMPTCGCRVAFPPPHRPIDPVSAMAGRISRIRCVVNRTPCPIGATSQRRARISGRASRAGRVLPGRPCLTPRPGCPGSRVRSTTIRQTTTSAPCLGRPRVVYRHCSMGGPQGGPWKGVGSVVGPQVPHLAPAAPSGARAASPFDPTPSFRFVSMPLRPQRVRDLRRRDPKIALHSQGGFPR